MFVLATQKFPHFSLLHQIMFGLSGPMAALSIGASILFLWGRKDFKAGPRRAYGLLCTGIIFFGISQIQFPLLEIFELRFLLSTPFGGLIALPYLLSVIFTLLGMRLLVHSLGIKTRLASLPLVITTAFAAAYLSTLLPHAYFAPGTFATAQINGAFAIWDATFYLFAAGVAWSVGKRVGPLYKSAMMWLFAGLIVVGLSAVNLFAATRFFHNSWYEQDSVSNIPLFTAAVLFVTAGYATLSIRRRFEAALVNISASGNVFLNVVMYATDLASTPLDIDPALDTARKITAAQPDKKFTPAQEQELCQTYGVIEDYLINREPLRPFDAATLREQVTNKFNLTPDQQAKLWGR